MARRKPSPKNDPAAQRYELVRAGDLTPHPENPNNGDVEALDESLDENGFYGACVVQVSTRYILIGNHRWAEFIKDHGEDALIPVIWADVDDERALAIMVSDNATRQGAKTDDGLLAGILKRLPTARGTGYKPPQVEALLKAARPKLDYLEAMRAGADEAGEGADQDDDGPFDAEDEGDDGEEADAGDSAEVGSSKELPRHPLPIVLTNSEQRRWASIKTKLGQSKDKPAFLAALEVLEQALS